MRAEDLSRTQWVVIGLMLGLVCAYMRLHIGQPDFQQTHTLANLERALLKAPTRGEDGKEYPWITDVLVYPAESIAGDSSSQQNIVLVTFNARIPADKQWQWSFGAVHLHEPVKPLNRAVDGSDLTVRAYLDSVGEAAGAGRVYRYAWWAEPKWIYITWTGMMILMVGGVWPLALSLLIGAGFGRRSEEKRPSLWQQWKAYRQDAARRAMRSAADPALQKRPSADSGSLTTEELDRLAAMEAGLKDFLASGSGRVDDEDETPQSSPVIRPLTAGPVEPPKSEDQKKEDKSYGGTFYPTVAHGKPRKPEEDTRAGE